MREGLYAGNEFHAERSRVSREFFYLFALKTAAGNAEVRVFRYFHKVFRIQFEVIIPGKRERGDKPFCARNGDDGVSCAVAHKTYAFRLRAFFEKILFPRPFRNVRERVEKPRYFVVIHGSAGFFRFYFKAVEPRFFYGGNGKVAARGNIITGFRKEFRAAAEFFGEVESEFHNYLLKYWYNNILTYCGG